MALNIMFGGWSSYEDPNHHQSNSPFSVGLRSYRRECIDVSIGTTSKLNMESRKNYGVPLESVG